MTTRLNNFCLISSCLLALVIVFSCFAARQLEYAKKLTDILMYTAKPRYQVPAVSELEAPILNGAIHKVDNPTD